MITQIKLENYRSIKNEISFSLIAESSKSKEENLFIKQLLDGKDEIRLLKSAIIYGPNASGKTNFLRSIFEIIHFIKDNTLKLGEDIWVYSPFKFSTNTKNEPVKFAIEFVGQDSIKYKYEISFNRKQILTESLFYSPFGREKLLYSRLCNDDKIHHIKPGSDLEYTDIQVFCNQPILSKFGSQLPHKIISDVYLYLTSIEVINACSSRKVSLLKNEVTNLLIDNQRLKKYLDELISFSDTGIEYLAISENDKNTLKFPDSMSNETKNKLADQYKYNIAGMHSLFDENNSLIGEESLAFENESHGTRTLYSLGGKILQVLESGSTLFIDEIDTGLHPFVSKLIVSLFQSSRINQKNAQLVFTTHDTNLLDRTMYRKDQIWFVEKNQYGISDLFSLQDFQDVREDTPFDKWYMAGKFGGIPIIKSIESLFLDNEKK